MRAYRRNGWSSVTPQAEVSPASVPGRFLAARRFRALSAIGYAPLLAEPSSSRPRRPRGNAVRCLYKGRAGSGLAAAQRSQLRSPPERTVSLLLPTASRRKDREEHPAASGTIGLPLSGGLFSILLHDGSRYRGRGPRQGRSCARPGGHSTASGAGGRYSSDECGLTVYQSGAFRLSFWSQTIIWAKL